MQPKCTRGLDEYLVIKLRAVKEQYRPLQDTTNENMQNEHQRKKSSDNNMGLFRFLYNNIKRWWLIQYYGCQPNTCRFSIVWYYKTNIINKCFVLDITYMYEKNTIVIYSKYYSVSEPYYSKVYYTVCIYIHDKSKPQYSSIMIIIKCKNLVLLYC